MAVSYHCLSRPRRAGVHDDTAALQRALSRPGAYTFLPFGVYAVLATLQLGCNSTLVGEGLAMIALVANAPGFNDTTGPLHPLFSTSREAGCYAAVADVTLTTLGTGNDAALLLDHQAGPGSGFWDLVGCCTCA